MLVNGVGCRPGLASTAGAARPRPIGSATAVGKLENPVRLVG
jgi:hypothetical protein